MVGGGGGDGGAALREIERKKEQKILDSIIRSKFFVPNNPDIKPGFVKQKPSANPFIATVQNTNAKVGPFKAFKFDSNPEITPERAEALQQVEEDVRNRFVPDFNELTDEATRELDFTLARRGLFGGSAQTDAEGRLGRRISKGEQDIASRVIGARSAKESFDNDLLNSLLAQSAAGASKNAIFSNLTNRFALNAQRAVNDATTSSLVNPFTNVSSLFKNINDASQFNSGGTAEAARLAALLRGNTRGPQGTQGDIS